MSAISKKNYFEESDLVLLLDRKSRKYLITLNREQIFHSHLGQLFHDQLINKSVGGWYRTDKGHVLLAIRPTLGDYVLEMPRGPQIVYPKDLGLIISLGDIFPGATVIESGLGSGSLTLALLRAVGHTGQVTTYEINESVIPKALNNIGKILPNAENLHVKQGDIYLDLTERDVDRVVLDVPEPWNSVSGVGNALVLGGILISFSPTILQVHQLVLTLQNDGRFQRIETTETLLRPWHITEQSVRPEHRMVAHSGFLTTAVKCEGKNIDNPDITIS